MNFPELYAMTSHSSKNGPGTSRTAMRRDHDETTAAKCAIRNKGLAYVCISAVVRRDLLRLGLSAFLSVKPYRTGLAIPV